MFRFLFAFFKFTYVKKTILIRWPTHYLFDSNVTVLFHSCAEGGPLPDARGWVLFTLSRTLRFPCPAHWLVPRGILCLRPKRSASFFLHFGTKGGSELGIVSQWPLDFQSLPVTAKSANEREDESFFTGHVRKSSYNKRKIKDKK